MVSMPKQPLVFVFAPRGLQWPGMGKQLFRESKVFQDTLMNCDKIIREILGWSLITRYQSTETENGLEASFPEDHIEPEITALQISLVEHLRSEGIVPDAVVGLSGGECPAAYTANGLNLSDALKPACAISLAVRNRKGTGKMLLLILPLPQVESLIRHSKQTVYITAVYSSNVCIIAGTEQSIEEIIPFFEAEKIKYYPIPSAFAYHSPVIDCWKELFFKTLEGLSPQAPAIPIYSAMTKGICSRPQDAFYWWDMIRQPAYFNEAITELLKKGYSTFLEISPHQTLSNSIQQTAMEYGKTVTLLQTLQKEEQDNKLMNQSINTIRSLQQIPLLTTQLL